jgi:hypothetical protein
MDLKINIDKAHDCSAGRADSVGDSAASSLILLMEEPRQAFSRVLSNNLIDEITCKIMTGIIYEDNFISKSSVIQYIKDLFDTCPQDWLFIVASDDERKIWRIFQTI